MSVNKINVEAENKQATHFHNEITGSTHYDKQPFFDEFDWGVFGWTVAMIMGAGGIYLFNL